MASAQLRDTRRRIKSVEAIKKITRAMELIATSRIPKAQARVNASKPYTAKLVEVIENVSAGGAGSHRLLERRDIKTVGLLIVSSDRGLAGSYASNVIRPIDSASICPCTASGPNTRAYSRARSRQNPSCLSISENTHRRTYSRLVAFVSASDSSDRR